MTPLPLLYAEPRCGAHRWEWRALGGDLYAVCDGCGTLRLLALHPALGGGRWRAVLVMPRPAPVSWWAVYRNALLTMAVGMGLGWLASVVGWV